VYMHLKSLCMYIRLTRYYIYTLYRINPVYIYAFRTFSGSLNPQRSSRLVMSKYNLYIYVRTHLAIIYIHMSIYIYLNVFVYIGYMFIYGARFMSRSSRSAPEDWSGPNTMYISMCVCILLLYIYTCLYIYLYVFVYIGYLFIYSTPFLRRSNRSAVTESSSQSKSSYIYVHMHLGIISIHIYVYMYISYISIYSARFR